MLRVQRAVGRELLPDVTGDEYRRRDDDCQEVGSVLTLVEVA